MSDGTRTEGARNKGKQAAEKQAKGGKLQSNPYSNARPGMKQAWQEAFDAELAGEPPPGKPEKPARKKPGRKPKVKPPESEPVDDDPVTVDEPIEVIPADDSEPEFMPIGDDSYQD